MYFENDYEKYVILPPDAKTEKTGSSIDSHRLFFNEEDVIDSDSKEDTEAIKENSGSYLGGANPEDFDSTTTYNNFESADSPKTLIKKFRRMV